jgi:Tat protein secretion system quality control protein TatD with DNase activity
VALTAACIAGLRGADPEALCDALTANAAKLFGITLT